MHPALVRLPVAVALALPLVGAPTLALPAPPATVAVHQDPAEHEAPEHDHAATRPSPDPAADEPPPDPGALSHDATGGEPISGEGSVHEEGHDPGSGSDEAPTETGGAGGHDETTGEHAESGGHAEEGAAPVARPRAAVLSTFVGVNAAVLIAAAVLRRGDRTRPRHRPRPAGAPTTA